MRTPWTEAEEASLVEIYSRPYICLSEAAKALGRGRVSIALKASRMGLTNSGKPRKAERKIRQPKFSCDTERANHLSQCRKEFLRKNGHPRGALGMKHSEDTKAILARKSRASWEDPNSAHHSERRKQLSSDAMMKNILAGKMRSGYSRSRGGKREDLGGMYFRSAWEANYARWLNVLVQKKEIDRWEYEPYTFVFEKIKRGTRAYTPDFKVFSLDGSHEWHEVKGWMDAKSKTRLARMERYFPQEKVLVIGRSWFKGANATVGRMIPGWESGTVK